jgi:hypothetical protein
VRASFRAGSDPLVEQPELLVVVSPLLSLSGSLAGILASPARDEAPPRPHRGPPRSVARHLRGARARLLPGPAIFVVLAAVTVPSASDLLGSASFILCLVIFGLT